MSEITLFTIGHSTHTGDALLHLLKSHNIQHLVDVRSTPYSRRLPHFNRETIKTTLSKQGIRYTFMGNSLGGRPSDPAHYDQTGRASYPKMRDTEGFRTSLQSLLDTAGNSTTVLMRSEKDPHMRHRTLLVAHKLEKIGPKVNHILGNGETLAHSKLVAALTTKYKLSPAQQDPLTGQQAVDLQASNVAYKR